MRRIAIAIGLLLITTKVYAIPTLVQDCGVTITTCAAAAMNINSCTFGTGHTAILLCADTNSGFSISSVSSSGDSWSSARNHVGFASLTDAEVDATNVTSGAKAPVVTWTGTQGTSCARYCDLSEWSGISTLALDTSHVNDVNSSTQDTGTATSGATPPILGLAISALTFSTGPLTGPSGGFTTLTNSNAGVAGSIFDAYRVSNSAPISMDASWTTTSSGLSANQLVILDAVTPTPTPTPTAAPTNTPTPTASSTATPVPTNTPPPTNTPTTTPVPTQTATVTPTNTPGPTSTATATCTATTTPTPRPTSCPGTNLFCNVISQGYMQMLPHHLNEAPAAPIDGQSFFCDDCVNSVDVGTCTTGGNGTIAFRIAGAWICL